MVAKVSSISGKRRSVPGVQGTTPSGRILAFPKKKAGFAPEEISYREEHGTWLSPMAQPSASQGRVPSEGSAPADKCHRRFVAKLAKDLYGIVTENKEHFGETIIESFKAYGFVACSSVSKKAVNEDALQRSLKHAPIAVPVKIFPETVVSTMDCRQGQPVSSALTYTWTEKGWVKQGRIKHEAILLVQVRHHTKLQSSHEMRRPVYCVNIKSYGEMPFDLRVMAIVKSEMPFLEAAAQAFSGPRDAFQGLPIVDHQGRALLEERIVRRAAFHYSNFQNSIKPGNLYDENKVPELIRYAHFIVSRSHLPELGLINKAMEAAL